MRINTLIISSSFKILVLLAMLAVFSSACLSGKRAETLYSADYKTLSMAGLETGKGYGQQEDRGIKGWEETARIVIEAQIAITVSEPDKAVIEIRDIIKEFDGFIVEEIVFSRGYTSKMTVRIPPDRLDDFIPELEKRGEVENRSIERKDVSWQIRDTELRLQNLRKTMMRYEELLHLASDVEQILKIEEELARVRRDIDLVEGKRKHLEMQVSMATVEINLMKDLVREKESHAKAWPGLKGTYLMISRYDEKPSHYVGLGWSIMESRSFHLDIDLFLDMDTLSAIEAGLITIGGDTYSSFMGNGERTWLNPHMGWALGYAWVEGSGNFAGMISMGMELYRGKYLFVDTGIRWGILAGRDGPSLALQPLASINVAF